MTRKKSNVIGFDPLAWMKKGAVATHENHKACDEERERIVSPPSPPAPLPSREGGEHGAVALGDSLTLERVTALHEQLKSALAAGNEAELDCSQVVAADTAGIQLLAAFARDARGKGMQLRWREPPQLLRDGVARLGLSGTLPM
jgi:ABC-type transporter Mla MlaB component